MTRSITQALLSIIVLASLTLAPQGAAQATGVTRYVSTTGADSTNCSSSAAPCLTITYAIGQAVAGDTIKVTVGAYSAVSGSAVVRVIKNVTLSGGWDAGFVSHGGLSTIDGGNARRGLRIAFGIIAKVDHFAVQNGFTPTDGGGISNGGSLTLANSRVSNNVSKESGGGIFNEGMLTINNSTISNNTAGRIGYTGGGGGGIEAYGPLIVNNTTINGNKVVAEWYGSAIGMGTIITLNNSTISGNTGDVAIDFTGIHLTLNNSTVSGNVSPYGSGGMLIRGGSVELNNSTVTANTTANGTGGILNVTGYSATVTLRNSILAGNKGTSGSVSDCKGKISSAGYNLLGSNAGCTFMASGGDRVGTATVPIDALLLPLANYGGRNRTHALAGNSPALDAGNPAAAGGGGNACLPADQRGVARPRGARCDIGAYEAQYPLVKSIARADPNPTSASTAKFNVTFSTTVTGVNKVAPFSDFKLATTGVTGAAISAVTGWGSTYSVSVKTGAGNGSIKLNLIDDGSIHDGKGNQLGGPGPRNGNFPAGQTYTIIKVSSFVTPDATLWDLLPTCQWTKIPGATQHQCQLAKGPTKMNTKTMLSSACGTPFTATSLTVLAPAIGSWRAGALATGICQTLTPYLSFKLVEPKVGCWTAT